MAIYFYKIPPFDATTAYTFEFVYTGNNQAHYNKLIIKESETLKVVFDKTIQTMQLKHTVPANTLKNGVEYTYQICVYDVDNKLCGKSDTANFQCLSTPTFKISNLQNNQTIKNSNYTFELSYSQKENDELQYFSISIYDKSKIALMSSGSIYDVTNLSYTFNGLNDSCEYYIKAVGYTVSGIDLSTDYILFNVEYISPHQWSLLTLENKPNIGAIQISSNVVTLTGTCSPTPIYLDDDFIDLRKANSYVTFDNGFSITNTGTIIGSMYGCVQNTIIATLENRDNSYKVNLIYKIGKFASSENKDVAYMELRAENGTNDYVIYSNYIDVPTSKDIVNFCIVRQNNLYEIKIYKEG